MFYRLGKNTKKEEGVAATHPSTLNNVRPRVKNDLTLASLKFLLS